MGAASVALAYLILRKILNSPTQDLATEIPKASPLIDYPALFGALVFAFSYQHWFQSGGGKGSIYTLNTFFAVTSLWILLKMREPGWFKRGFALFVFFLGMALSVHWETQAVLLPAYAWFLVTAQNRIQVGEIFRNLLRPLDLAAVLNRLAGVFSGPAGWIRTVVFLLLPLSTYLFLPIRSATGPALNWWNPRFFDRFLTVVMRGNYAGTGDPHSLETVHRNLARFWVHAHDQYGSGFTFLLLSLVLIGSIWLWRYRRVNAIGLMLFGGGVFGGVILYNTPKAGYEWTLDNFFTPFFLSLAFFAAAGVKAVMGWIGRLNSIRILKPVIGVAALMAALLPLGLNYHVNDQSAYTVSYDEGMNMLKTAKKNGVILCNGDIDILPLWYLQLAEGKRPDVASFTTQLVAMQWYRDDIVRQWPFMALRFQGDYPPDAVVEEMIKEKAAEHPFYVTNIYPQGAAFLWGNHPLVPDGMLWRLADTQGQNFAFNTSRVNQLWSQYQLRNLQVPERKYWDDYTDVMKDAYGQACSFTGEFAMANHMPEVAQWSYEKALHYHQTQILGVTYLRLGDCDMALGQAGQAITHYQQSFQWPMPRNYAPYAYARMGDAFLIQKDLPDAEQAFRAALGLNPQQKEALDGLRELDNLRNKS